MVSASWQKTNEYFLNGLVKKALIKWLCHMLFMVEISLFLTKGVSILSQNDGFYQV